MNLNIRPAALIYSLATYWLETKFYCIRLGALLELHRLLCQCFAIVAAGAAGALCEAHCDTESISSFSRSAVALETKLDVNLICSPVGILLKTCYPVRRSRIQFLMKRPTCATDSDVWDNSLNVDSSTDRLWNYSKTYETVEKNVGYQYCPPHELLFVC